MIYRPSRTNICRPPPSDTERPSGFFFSCTRRLRPALSPRKNPPISRAAPISPLPPTPRTFRRVSATVPHTPGGPFPAQFWEEAGIQPGGGHTNRRKIGDDLLNARTRVIHREDRASACAICNRRASCARVPAASNVQCQGQSHAFATYTFTHTHTTYLRTFRVLRTERIGCCEFLREKINAFFVTAKISGGKLDGSMSGRGAVRAKYTRPGTKIAKIGHSKNVSKQIVRVNFFLRNSSVDHGLRKVLDRTSAVILSFKPKTAVTQRKPADNLGVVITLEYLF